MSEGVIGQAYRESRERLTAWARTLDERAADTPVPALPGWTVSDTFAHLSGLAADVLHQGLNGPPDDATTARQVAERRGLSLPEVLDEWSTVGPEVEQALIDRGRAAPIEIAVDVWNHEVDMRSALGVPLPVGTAADRIFRRLTRRGVGFGWPAETPALRIRLVGDEDEGDEWLVGQGEPAGTLSVSLFELGRVMLGRRSPAQMAALDWSGGDPAPWIQAIPVFGPSKIDVIDSDHARD